jgi:hypothetical protein
VDFYIYLSNKVPSVSQVKKDMRAFYDEFLGACQINVGQRTFMNFKTDKDVI